MEKKLLDFICAEFKNRGLPKELAKAIFDGITQDCAEDWSEAQFHQWCDELKLKFPQYSTAQLINSHGLVNELTAAFTQVLKSFRLGAN